MSAQHPKADVKACPRGLMIYEYTTWIFNAGLSDQIFGDGLPN